MPSRDGLELAEMGVFALGEFGRNLACLSRQLAAGANRRFEFQKGSQLFIHARNEPLPVVAVRTRNSDSSPLRIEGGYAALTPIRFAEIVSD